MTRYQDTTCEPPDLAPDHTDLLGSETRPDEDTPHIPHKIDVEFWTGIYEGNGPTEGGGKPVEAGTPHIVVNGDSLGTGPGRARHRPADRRERRLEGPLTHHQVRELRDARAFASDLDRPLNCAVDVNPSMLITLPEEDRGTWLRDGPLKSLATFFAREKDKAGRPLGWHAIATRENFEGESREHGHLVCHCPRCLRPKMLDMLRRCYPGDGVFEVGTGDLDDGGFAYRCKQMTGQAAGPPRRGRPTPQRRSKIDGAAVAPVLGRRIFVSRSIDKAARTHAGWQQERYHQRQAQRDHYAARRREMTDV